MRSLFLPNLKEELELHNKKLRIEGPSFHHLVNVVRIKLNEKIKINLGEGYFVLTKVEEILKKEIILSIFSEKIEFRERSYKNKINLVLATPKKDAYETILSTAIQIGVAKIVSIQTKNSQKFEFKTKRLETIINSAMEQSNNLYLPIIEDFEHTLDEIIGQINKEKAFGVCFTLTDRPIEKNSFGEKLLDYKKNQNEDIYYFIGPEGGFTQSEIDLMQENNIHIINLPAPIMRAQTAVATCFGFLLQ